MQNISLVFQVNKDSIELFVFNESLENMETKVFLLESVLAENGVEALDLFGISTWLLNQYDFYKESTDFNVTFTNFVSFSSYLVCINSEGKVLAPILKQAGKSVSKHKKEFQELLIKEGVSNIGNFSFNIEAGLQFFSLKKNKSEIFKNTKHALMLPEFLQFIFTKNPIASLSGLSFLPTIFCTQSKNYLKWIEEEKVNAINIPFCNNSDTTEDRMFGTGINNLIGSIVPFLRATEGNFLLLQSSDWNICWNPFNDTIADDDNIKKGVFNAINHKGETINGCKLYAGNEHDRAVKHLADYFSVDENYFMKLKFEPKTVQFLRKTHKQAIPIQTELGAYKDSPFMERNLNSFRNYADAYHQFIMDIIAQQTAVVKLILGTNQITTIFVEGRFSENSIFMSLLSESFIYQKVYACQLKNVAALGAALLKNDERIDKKLLQLKSF